MSSNSTLRSQLIGAWSLVSYACHLPNDESNKVYPMGPNATGIIMYTPDGYMSAQLMRPSSDPQGHQYIAYTGQFYLDEQGDEQGRPVLMHHMGSASIPSLVGDTQRRLMRIEGEGEERVLVLGVEGTMKVEGEERVVVVRWKRCKLNEETKAPAKM